MCSSFSGCRQSLDEAYSDAYNQPDRPLRFPWAQPQSPRRFAPAGQRSDEVPKSTRDASSELVRREPAERVRLKWRIRDVQLYVHSSLKHKNSFVYKFKRRSTHVLLLF